MRRPVVAESIYDYLFSPNQQKTYQQGQISLLGKNGLLRCSSSWKDYLFT